MNIFFQFQLDIINEWIDRIQESEKHHSMSPSYTSHSRIQPIPVSSLPLQNERVVKGGGFQGKGPNSNNQIFHSPVHPKKKQKRLVKGK